MTNDPRYSPPPQQPGYRAGPNQPVPPAYVQAHQQPYNQHFDWRYPPPQPGQPAQAAQTTQYRRPYEPFGGTGAGRSPGGYGGGADARAYRTGSDRDAAPDASPRAPKAVPRRRVGRGRPGDRGGVGR